MKIVLLPSAFYPNIGGVEEVTRNLAMQCVAAGHEIRIAVHRYPHTLLRSETIDGLRVDRFDFEAPFRNLSALPRLAKGAGTYLLFEKYLRDFAPNLIHVISPSSASLYVAMASKRTGIPVLVSLHGELFMDAHAIYQRSAYARWALQRLLNNGAGVTACSQYTLDHSKQNFDFGNLNSKVILNGVDLNEGSPLPSKVESNPFIFAIGRVVQNKGFDVLIKAFAQIAPGFPEVSLVLAGEGPEIDALSALSGECGVADRVHFVGRLDRNQVVAYFREALFFVLPSPCEPFGIVCLEAMRGGKAQIVTNVGGPPEFVRENIDGLLVAPNDVPQLTQAMSKLLSDAALRQRMGENARAYVRESFTWEKIGAEYMQTYQEVLDAAGGRGLR